MITKYVMLILVKTFWAKKNVFQVKQTGAQKCKASFKNLKTW